MKKELKDYLHLYLGCECKTPIGILVFNCVNISDSRNNVWFYCRWSDKKNCYLPKQNAEILSKQSLVGKAFKYSEIKPILRKLSDMTDEELKNLRSERGNLKGVERADMNYIIRLNTWSPEDVRYLLSRHFDLFGLISSGLAIDSKTLKEKI